MTLRAAHPADTAVMLPGTGSDDVFIRSAFQDAVACLDVRLIAPEPDPGRGIAERSLRTLDAAAERLRAPMVVGGVSFGAHIAATWALRHPDRCAGLLVALPAWNGEPAEAPAAFAAQLSAQRVREDGLERALHASTRDVAPWLARELNRSWRRHGADLADSLESAAAHPAPELAALRNLHVPTGIAACSDDPVHPAGVAHAWGQALPLARLHEITLTALGRDPATLGRAAVLALLQALTAR